MRRSPVRTLAIACPDWPILAAGLSKVPAALLKAGRVVACSGPARAEGVQVGQRRREAEGLAGDLKIIRFDPALEARMFETVVAAAASFTPRVEITRPGICSFPTRGPARYFGGEAALVGKVAAGIDAVLGALPGGAGVTCQIGVADGPFAALLAATGDAGRGAIVERGKGRDFLAPFPLEVIGVPDLVDLLRRLGVRTLGDLGEMPEIAVAARFGAEGARAWHFAHGLEDRSLVLTDPPPDLAVWRQIDPPDVRLDATVFMAVGLAEDLCRRLGELELACTRLAVEVETEHGETLRRLWRADRALTARMMVDRVRWQLEGWLTGTVEGEEPTAGVAVLRLMADEVVRDRGRQLGFWGEVSEADRRAERGLTRVQGMLGHDAVMTAVRSGGRAVGEQVRLVPWGDPRDDGKSALPLPPWPGRIPAPSPLSLLGQPVRAKVLDATGEAVQVSGRGLPSAAPAKVGIGESDRDPRTITAWAGPWPVDERWWDTSSHSRRARFQVVAEGGDAYLLVLEGGSWWVEAVYD